MVWPWKELVIAFHSRARAVDWLRAGLMQSWCIKWKGGIWQWLNIHVLENWFLSLSPFIFEGFKWFAHKWIGSNNHFTRTPWKHIQVLTFPKNDLCLMQAWSMSRGHQMIRISRIFKCNGSNHECCNWILQKIRQISHLLEERKHRLSVCHGQSMTWKQNLHAWKHF